MGRPRVCFTLLATATLALGALPEPPQQRTPWKPARGSDSSLPSWLAEVTAALFEAGVADPRGGEYREIEIARREWGREPTFKTRGWVFPNGWAVRWNGLFSPTVRVGGAADLEKDVREFARQQDPNSGFNSRGGPVGSSFEGMADRQAMAAGILLRLGRADLAELVWRPARQGGVNAKSVLERGLTDWLGEANLWLATARGRGDDLEAVQIAESILIWRQRVRARLTGSKEDATAFLQPVDALLRDSQRRLAEPTLPAVDLARMSASQRAAALVARLDQLRGAKVGFPGPWSFGLEPDYQQLKQAGEVAVGPLLEAYENDTRLTRALDFGRPWYYERTPIPVKDVAKRLLADILKAPGKVEQLSPAELRAWWQEQAAHSPAARSLAVLADDKASPEQWEESAALLTSIERTTEAACREDRSTVAPPLQGESLRAGQGAFVSQLLARRTAQLAELSRGDENSNEIDPFSKTRRERRSCQMAFAAFRWDGASALAVLKEAAARVEACRGDGWNVAARLSLGDAAAAGEWAEQLVKGDWKSVGLVERELAPLWLFPENPGVRAGAEWLFARPGAPLRPGSSIAPSPFLANPVFRRALLAELADETIVGNVEIGPDGSVGTTSMPGKGEAPLPPPPTGTTRHPFRRKDAAARSLHGLPGTPMFELSWPESRRNEAARQVAAWLVENGAKLRAGPSLADSDCMNYEAYLDGQPTLK